MFTKPKRRVDKIFVHCSASDNKKHDDVSVMRKWQLARGWSDVGYHFFIKKDGTLQSGRSLERMPAANRNDKKIKGFAGNRGTIAICLHGLKEENFTEAQYGTLRKLCQTINDAYNKRVTFHGHREVAWKACPVIDYKHVLNLDGNGHIK